MTAGELIAVIIIFTLAGGLLVIDIVHFLYSQRSVHRCWTVPCSSGGQYFDV